MFCMHKVVDWTNQEVYDAKAWEIKKHVYYQHSHQLATGTTSFNDSINVIFYPSIFLDVCFYSSAFFLALYCLVFSLPTPCPSPLCAVWTCGESALCRDRQWVAGLSHRYVGRWVSQHVTHGICVVVSLIHRSITRALIYWKEINAL